MTNGVNESDRTIVVSGDVLIEWRLAQSAMRNRVDNDGAFDPYNYMEIYFKPVGAMSVGEIIKRSLTGLPAIFPGRRPRMLIPERENFIDEKCIDYTSPYWHSYVICAQYPKNAAGDVVWRVKQKLGIDRKRYRVQELQNLVEADTDGDASLIVIEQSNQGFIQNPEIWPRSLRHPRNPEASLLLEWTRPSFDDKESKFWQHVAEFFPGRTVIVVTAEDLRLAGMRISRGLSWERTASDLYEGVLSVVDATRLNARLALTSCKHLIVSFGTSGAAMFSRDARGELFGTLIYDPLNIEGQWAEQYEGSMSGFTRCVTAGVALEMLRAPDPSRLQTRGIIAAVVAARRMLQNGFDTFGRQALIDTDLPGELRYPAADIARVLRNVMAYPPDDETAIQQDRTISRRLHLALEELPPSAPEDDVVQKVRDVLKNAELDVDALAAEVVRIYRDWRRTAVEDRSLRTVEEKACVPDDQWEQKVFAGLAARVERFIAPDEEAIVAARGLREQAIDARCKAADWSILESALPADVDGTEKAYRIIEMAHRLVEFGDIDPKWHFPTARIGRLFITGRQEFESLTRVRDLILDYVRSTSQTPLSIAVFGAPGSGKSFAINELAAQLPDGDFKVESRTFNLSQFSGPEAIASALQQVRDIGLSGKMPLVFWDEFDSTYGTPLGWLRYFLAPMQDGKFQDEFTLRYVGRAIFVFAGGKYKCMDALLEHNKEPGRDSEFRAKAKDRKVPDFISRLKGFYDVPELDYHLDGTSDFLKVKIDAATALRRAKLLRSFLEREGSLEETIPAGDRAGQGVQQRLNVDQAVVAAFLRIHQYKYGARSMEAIVKMSALYGKDRYDRSMLPPPDQLALHVNADHFFQLVQGIVPQYRRAMKPARAQQPFGRRFGALGSFIGHVFAGASRAVGPRTPSNSADSADGSGGAARRRMPQSAGVGTKKRSDGQGP